jgi:tRNA-2-methylthio-N6-dimethylallyladenosine synthase
VLKAMRRSYRKEKYLGILDRVRQAMPDAAITTDIIVGFPGETEEDFAETLDVVRQARFASAFTFQYSRRPGTPAADLPELPKEVVQERYMRLAAAVEETAWAENQRLEGRTVELLVSDHSAAGGRKDHETQRLTGRARDNRLVHFAPRGHDVRPGDLVEVTVTHAAPHHLVSDADVVSYRRTRAGDAWEARQGRTEVRPAVSLGMPSLGVPAPLPVVDAPACAR